MPPPPPPFDRLRRLRHVFFFLDAGGVEPPRARLGEVGGCSSRSLGSCRRGWRRGGARGFGVREDGAGACGGAKVQVRGLSVTLKTGVGVGVGVGSWGLGGGVVMSCKRVVVYFRILETPLRSRSGFHGSNEGVCVCGGGGSGGLRGWVGWWGLRTVTGFVLV